METWMKKMTMFIKETNILTKIPWWLDKKCWIYNRLGYFPKIWQSDLVLNRGDPFSKVFKNSTKVFNKSMMFINDQRCVWFVTDLFRSSSICEDVLRVVEIGSRLFINAQRCVERFVYIGQWFVQGWRLHWFATMFIHVHGCVRIVTGFESCSSLAYRVVLICLNRMWYIL